LKKIILNSLLLLLINASSHVLAQGFKPPEGDNAVVYFVRVSNWGGAVSFEYFHNTKFIGIFKGQNYIRYECPAGENLLWVSSEDKEFLKCDLKAGET